MLPYKILIVDDDADDREFYTDTFHKIGVEQVLAVASAWEAIAFLDSVQNDSILPRLIVTDLNMPRVSGVQLLRALKTMPRYCQIPVIVCTTSNSVHDAEQCMTSGAAEYITKPITVIDYEVMTHKMSRLALGETNPG